MSAEGNFTSFKILVFSWQFVFMIYSYIIIIRQDMMGGKISTHKRLHVRQSRIWKHTQKAFVILTCLNFHQSEKSILISNSSSVPMNTEVMSGEELGEELDMTHDPPQSPLSAQSSTLAAMDDPHHRITLKTEPELAILDQHGILARDSETDDWELLVGIHLYNQYEHWEKNLIVSLWHMQCYWCSSCNNQNNGYTSKESYKITATSGIRFLVGNCKND